jgi:hypothetical protein
MTPEESRLLSELLDRLARLPAGYKDAEADALIRAAMIKLPDAPYQLVQATILHEQAAAQAKARIDQLESENARLRQQLAATPPQPTYAQSPVPMAPAPSPWGAPQVSPWGAPRSGGFLSGVAETAVGVAGGMLLAQGVSNLFGGHSSAWGGSPWGGGTTIVENNTYVNETINETNVREASYDTDSGDFDDGGDDFGSI